VTTSLCTERATPLLTVGHGRLDRDELGALLLGAGVQSLVDVRRFPGSRSNLDVHTDALASWLPECGIRYRWEQRLGGRRSLPAGETSRDSWWTVAAFRAYAAHTRTDDFRAALAGVLDQLDVSVTAVMCSESVWWRCHRRLIADVSVLAHGRPVLHLMAGGRLAEHRVADGARLRPDGLVVWDG
jgi:uncharacterized protein (DUF488 family)